MALEMEIGDNLRQEWTSRMSNRRATKTWMNFPRDRRSSNHVASFEHDWLQTSFSQICSRDQTVVTGADNYDVH